MYNEEWKQDYLDKQQIANVNIYKNYFNKSKATEESLGKDLCEFTRYDILNYYKSMSTSSFFVLYNMHSLFKRYTDYCLSKGVVGDGQNHYCEINQSDIMAQCVNRRVLNKKIMTREDVEYLCASFANPRESFAALAIFEYGGGKEYKDIWKLKLSQFDGKGKLSLDRGDVEVDNLLYMYAQEADGELTYITQKSTRPLMDEGYIYKYSTSCKSERSRDKYWSFTNSFNKQFKILEADYIMLGNIELSGIIDFIKRKSEIAGISSKEYLFTHTDNINYQYDKSINPSVFLNKIGGEL